MDQRTFPLGIDRHGRSSIQVVDLGLRAHDRPARFPSTPTPDRAPALAREPLAAQHPFHNKLYNHNKHSHLQSQLNNNNNTTSYNQPSSHYNNQLSKYNNLYNHNVLTNPFLCSNWKKTDHYYHLVK